MCWSKAELLGSWRGPQVRRGRVAQAAGRARNRSLACAGSVRAGTEASIIKPAGLRQLLGVRGLEEAQTTGPHWAVATGALR